MKQTLTLAMLLLVSTILTSCGDSAVPGGSNSDSYVQGQAIFQDARTNTDGSLRDPAFPAIQTEEETMTVNLKVKGEANLANQQTDGCELNGDTKKFKIGMNGTAEIDETGFYFGILPLQSGKFLSDVGNCIATSVDQITITKALVMGKLVNNDNNCSDYCSAKARLHGEVTCATSDSACRFAEEIKYVGSCVTQCKTEASYIGAETLLGTDELVKLNDLRNIPYFGFGTVEADLVFTLLFDANGAVVVDVNHDDDDDNNNNDDDDDNNNNDDDDDNNNNDDDDDNNNNDDDVNSCGENKSYVCHKQGKKNAHTLCISENALEAHLGHGDTIGRCEE